MPRRTTGAGHPSDLPEPSCVTLGESRFLSELLAPPGEDAGNNTLPGGCREGSELTVGEHLRF